MSTLERLVVSIGAISGLVLLMSCGLLAYVTQRSELSREDMHLAWFGIFITGVSALCIFLAALAGYIAMGFLGEKD